MPSAITPIPMSDRRVQRALSQLERVRGRWLSYDEVEAIDVGFAPDDDGNPTDEVCVRVHVTQKRDESELPVDAVFNGNNPDRCLPDPDVRLVVLEAYYAASSRSDLYGGCGDAHVRHTVAGPQRALVDVVPDLPDPDDIEGRERRRRQRDRRRRRDEHDLRLQELEGRDEAAAADGHHHGLGGNRPDEDAYDRRARTTPLLGGISIGNPRTTAGTLGAIVWDLETGTPCILSNWHVLAGSVPAASSAAEALAGAEPHYHGAGIEPHYHGAGLEPHYHGAGPEPHYHGAGPEPHYHGAGPEPHYHGAGPEPHYHGAGLEPHYHGAGPEPHYHAGGPEPHYHQAGGEPHYHPAGRVPWRQAARMHELIYQPGRFDGGTAEDVVARLTRWCLDHRMDAAIARLTGHRAMWPALLGLPTVTGSREPRLGATVYKSGRTTGVTRGIIDGVGLSTSIDFPHGPQSFEGQLRIAPHPDDIAEHGRGRVETSEPGDSGALWVDADGWLAVGLHFGGDVLGSYESEHSLASPIRCVEEELGFSFTPVPRVLPRRR